MEPLLALALLRERCVVVAQRDVGSTGEALDRLDEVEMLDLAHERDRVTALLTTEAVPHALLGAHRERRRLLLMERAQPLEATADAFQRDVFADQCDEIRRFPHSRDVVVENAHRVAGYGLARGVTRLGEALRDASRAARHPGRARTGRSCHSRTGRQPRPPRASPARGRRASRWRRAAFGPARR